MYIPLPNPCTWWTRRAAEAGKHVLCENPLAMTGVFSYFNDDATNIRNSVTCGGGALMDIGCYLVMTSRLLFGREPSVCSPPWTVIRRSAPIG